jgi:hypothetical protein
LNALHVQQENIQQQRQPVNVLPAMTHSIPHPLEPLPVPNVPFVQNRDILCRDAMGHHLVHVKNAPTHRMSDKLIDLPVNFKQVCSLLNYINSAQSVSQKGAIY